MTLDPITISKREVSDGKTGPESGLLCILEKSEEWSLLIWMEMVFLVVQIVHSPMHP
jgi:hypothetical protein